MEILVVKTIRSWKMRGAEGPEHQIKKKLKLKKYFKLLSIFNECGKCECGKRASSRSEGRAEGLFYILKEGAWEGKS